MTASATPEWASTAVRPGSTVGGPVALRPDLIIDGVADEPFGGHEIVLEGTQIAAVRPIRDDPGVAVVTLAGVTVVPGLIDCHAHYMIDGSADLDGIHQGDRDPVERVMLVGARNARTALRAGVTTARGAGSSRGLDIALAAGIDAGDIPGPRLLPAGPAITITGGHGKPIGVEVDGIDRMITAVRRAVRDGAQVIKLVASEAAMLTTDRAAIPELSAAEMTALAAEAHRLRCTVLAHAQSSEAVRAAATAGVDSVEHAFLADEEALRVLRDSGAFLTPTLAVTDVYSRLPGLSPAQRARQATLSVAHRRSCETAIRLGIPLATGTDCGVAGILPDMLGLEVALLAEHGLAPMNAIKAATSSAARLLGRSGELGVLAPGATADLLAVPGNPLTDLRTLGEPTLVIKDGAVVHRRQAPLWPRDAHRPEQSH